MLTIQEVYPRSNHKQSGRMKHRLHKTLSALPMPPAVKVPLYLRKTEEFVVLYFFNYYMLFPGPTPYPRLCE